MEISLKGQLLSREKKELWYQQIGIRKWSYFACLISVFEIKLEHIHM